MPYHFINYNWEKSWNFGFLRICHETLGLFYEFTIGEAGAPKFQYIYMPQWHLDIDKNFYMGTIMLNFSQLHVEIIYMHGQSNIALDVFRWHRIVLGVYIILGKAIRDYNAISWDQTFIATDMKHHIWIRFTSN